jgi:single-stranded-DNA-specific exonuclease
MIKQMEILSPNKTTVQKIQKQTGFHPITAHILANRGISSKKSITDFFNPSFDQIRSFETLIDMDKAVERITHAILKNEKILVFGDYDVDGITSTTLLYEFLTTAEADVTYYIPHRIEEGYGLNVYQIEQIVIPGGFNLVITIDCGSTSHDAIDYANQSGIDIVITDHHTISDFVPKAVAVVNPKRHDCPSGSSYLAGVGVAFCLLIRLRKHLREIDFWKNKPEPNLKALCDLVALGTIADIVPLIHENRIMTKAGLEVINTCPRPGLDALIKLSGINKSTVNAEDIAFRLSPRLNASGRMDHAQLAVQLLHTKDIDEAFTIAKTLNALNTQRQEIEQKIFHHILMYFNEKPELMDKRTVVLGKQDWHEGVLGIVASKLVEKFYRPVILISFKENVGKGSARSIPGINLYDALCQCSEYLEGFGGHPMAAGLSIKKENLNPFQSQFEKIIKSMTSRLVLRPKLCIDCRLDFDMISDRLMDELSMLQPFGQDNPEPLFCTEKVDVTFSKIIGKNHRKLILKQRNSKTNKTVNAIWFNVDGENLNKKYFETIAFKLHWNHWNGKKSIQAIVEYA